MQECTRAHALHGLAAAIRMMDIADRNAILLMNVLRTMNAVLITADHRTDKGNLFSDPDKQFSIRVWE